MEDSVGAGGSDSSGVERRGLSKQSSNSNLIPGMSERSGFDIMNASRVNALRATVNRHSDAAMKALLASKETLANKAVIEAAFRTCRDAFMEIATILINVFDERITSSASKTGDVKRIVGDELNAFRGRGLSSSVCHSGNSEKSKSYASVVGNSGHKDSNISSFIVMPDEAGAGKFPSAQVTKETLCKVFRPADCELKIKKILLVRNNGVRIEALSLDLKKIKSHPGLAAAGL